jgi:aconitate hydratase
MGILPLQFKAGENVQSLGLTGYETYEIKGISDGLKAGKELSVEAKGDKGKAKKFKVTCRIDMPAELDYYRHGGILEYVLRQLAK